MRRLLVLALLSVLMVGCTRAVDAARASQIAKDLVVQGQPAGTTFVSLAVSSTERHDDAWRVYIDAEIVPADQVVPSGGRPQHALIHFLFDVDAGSGHATVVAQG
jgi:hypothetical protein